MKIELVNIHTHTRFCGHGEGEVAEVISQAAKHGITTLALTEHFPLPEQLDPDAYLSMLQRFLRLCNPVEEVRKVRHGSTRHIRQRQEERLRRAGKRSVQELGTNRTNRLGEEALTLSDHQKG